MTGSEIYLTIGFIIGLIVSGLCLKWGWNDTSMNNVELLIIILFCIGIFTVFSAIFVPFVLILLLMNKFRKV